jgi:hypothetical protein
MEIGVNENINLDDITDTSFDEARTAALTLSRELQLQVWLPECQLIL